MAIEVSPGNFLIWTVQKEETVNLAVPLLATFEASEVSTKFNKSLHFLHFQNHRYRCHLGGHKTCLVNGVEVHGPQQGWPLNLGRCSLVSREELREKHVQFPGENCQVVM